MLRLFAALAALIALSLAGARRRPRHHHPRCLGIDVGADRRQGAHRDRARDAEGRCWRACRTTSSSASWPMGIAARATATISRCWSPPAAGHRRRHQRRGRAAQPARARRRFSASVKMAAEELKYTEDKATVILITDGHRDLRRRPLRARHRTRDRPASTSRSTWWASALSEGGRRARSVPRRQHRRHISSGRRRGRAKNALDRRGQRHRRRPAGAAAAASEEPVSDINFDADRRARRGRRPAGRRTTPASPGSSTRRMPTARRATGCAPNTAPSYKGTIEPGDYIVTRQARLCACRRCR